MPKIFKKPEVTIGLASPAEIAILKTWRKLDKEVDEFVYCWTLWKNWEQHPPIVARDMSLSGADMLVGYHGAAYAKNEYVNSASQFVLPEHRGRGISGKMIDFLLKKASDLGLTRLRFRTPLEGDGYQCWKGLGAVPFATGEGDFWYDLCIDGVTCLQEFMHRAGGLVLPPASCRRRLGLYRKAGLTALLPVYKELLCE